jgi:hypothetical protein
MGGSFSNPSQDMPTTLNFILREMFRRADLTDIYSLADPDRCKRYIVVATDALESLFIKMRVYPDKKDGAFFLQSIDGIIKSMPPDIRAKQREYCVEIAFFFIRIFQTFGALYLSMYDSKLPITDPSDDIARAAATSGSPFLNPKNFLGFSNPQPQSQSQSWFGSGGDLTLRSGRYYIDPARNPAYSILNFVLNSKYSEADTTPMTFSGSSNLYIPQITLYTTDAAGQRSLKDPPEPEVFYTFTRGSNTYTLHARLNIEGPIDNGAYRVSLINFTPEGVWQGVSAKSISNSNVEILQIRSITARPASTGTAYPETKDYELSKLLTYMFNKAVIQAIGAPDFSISSYLRKIGYISGDTSQTQLIRGSKVYILANQDNQSTVRIAYKDNITYQDNDTGKPKTAPIIIGARLTIDKPQKQGNDSLGIIYKVTIDLSQREVKPAELSNLVQFPDERTKYQNFSADTETSIPASEKDNISIPEYLQRTFQKIVSKAGDPSLFGKGLSKTRDGFYTPYESDQIPDSLKVKKLWAVMAKDPPVKSHCVARAVQLLSLDAIKGDLNKTAYSSICRLTFGYQKDGSLPTVGKPVIESAGIYAMSLLFFEGLVANAPKIIDPDAYKEYLKYLKYLFERYPDVGAIKDGPPGDPDAIPQKLGDIDEKTLNICKDRGDSRLILDKPLASNLRSVTNDLMRQQQAHFQKAIALIFMIFDQSSIERNRVLKFNPRIISIGMPEVDRIATSTRQLLLEYYKGCELSYRDGLAMIYKYDSNLKASTGEGIQSMTVDQISRTPVETTTTKPPSTSWF